MDVDRLNNLINGGNVCVPVPERTELNTYPQIEVVNEVEMQEGEI